MEHSVRDGRAIPGRYPASWDGRRHETPATILALYKRMCPASRDAAQRSQRPVPDSWGLGCLAGRPEASRRSAVAGLWRLGVA
eukprot:3665799-Prymnesium_polylepis.1